MFEGLDQGATIRTILYLSLIVIPEIGVTLFALYDNYKKRQLKEEQAREQKILRVPKEEMTVPKAVRLQRQYNEERAVFLTPNEDSLAPDNYKKAWERLNPFSDSALEVIEYEPTMPCALYQPVKERVMDTASVFSRQFIFPPLMDAGPNMITVTESHMSGLPIGEWERLVALLRIHTVNGKELYVMWSDPGKEAFKQEIAPGEPELILKDFLQIPDTPPLVQLCQKVGTFTSSTGVCIHFEGKELRIEVLDPEDTKSLVFIGFNWIKMKTILP